MTIPEEMRQKFDVKLPYKDCELCPLNGEHRDERSQGSWGIWDSSIDYIFVTDRGGYKGFIADGTEGQWLQDLIIDIELTNFLITASCLCRPTDEVKSLDSPTNCCYSNTELIIQSAISVNKQFGAPPPKIILLGKGPIARFFDDKATLKASLNSLRNQKLRSPWFDADIYITYSPASLKHNPEWSGLIRNDIINATKAEKQQEVDDSYLLIEDLDELKAVRDMLMESPDFAYDIETSGTNYVVMQTVKERKRKGKKVRELDWKVDEIIGISFSNESKSGCYIPLDVKGHVIQSWIDAHHPEWGNFNLERDTFYHWFGDENRDEVIAILKEILENDSEKYAHNGKFDNKFLKIHFGIDVKNFKIDTMLAAHVVNEEASKSLEFLSDSNYADLAGYKQVVYSQLTEEQIEIESYADLSIDHLAVYGPKDTDATYRLAKDLMVRLDKEHDEWFQRIPNSWVNGRWLVENLYMPLQLHYMEAEIEGILFDVDYASKIAVDYKEKMAEIQSQVDYVIDQLQLETPLCKETDRKINLNSSDQMRELMFNILGWPVFKETKKAKEERKYRRGDWIDPDDASTDQDSLKQLMEYFEQRHNQDNVDFIQMILEYKKYNKMITTYLEGKKILSHLDTNNRVHASYLLHGTSSGRLSSRPNVQNLPKKTRKSNIRGIFIAKPGYKLWSSDLSQAELRIMADYAQDLVMLDYIARGEDIHWKGCLEIFYHGQNLSYDSHDFQMKRYRKLTKLCNFGKLYGAASPKVMQSVNEKLEKGEEKISLAIADAHGEWFFSEFYRIKEYLAEMEDHILTYGWIDSKLGRRRHLPDAFSDNKMKRAEAVRSGINSQIQGSASDIAQFGFMKVRNWIKENNLRSNVLFSVHDEIDGELHPDEEELMSINVPRLMVEKVYPIDIFKVKLESEFEVFNNRWGD
jgi:DNA polymerase I-like protein with 3'-5' exonuclease and polymerase domains